MRIVFTSYGSTLTKPMPSRANMISEGNLVDAAPQSRIVGLFASNHRGKVSQDDFSGRVHHPGRAAMKRALRRLLRHDDGELVTPMHTLAGVYFRISGEGHGLPTGLSEGLFWKELGGYTLTSEKKDWLKKQVYCQFYG